MTNLKYIKKSTSQPMEGDIFAAQLPHDRFIFGYVCISNAMFPQSPAPGAYLIIILADLKRYVINIDEIALGGALLIPPLWTNRRPWTSGIFSTIGNSSLPLRNFCFRDPARDGVYLDEKGRRTEVNAWCGEWSLASYRAIDDRISDALGLPRVP